ncbi:MAG: hypothetical protein U0822_24120 [Anaerolineae bacterium]
MGGQSVPPDDVKSIQDDILTIVGGNFTPVSLGVDGYEAVRSRARSRAADYLAVFEQLFLGANFDAMLQSRLHLPTFLELLSDVEPEAVRQTADRLLKQYDAVLIMYDQAKDKSALFELLPEDSMRLFQRLDSRRKSLQLLAEGKKG